MGITAQYVRVSKEECTSLTFDDSGERLEELLDEKDSPKDRDELFLICWKYSQSGMNGWKNVEKTAKKMKLSEEKLNQEIKKRGLHMWLDLDKRWDEMHKLLNGMSLHEELKKETRLITPNKSADTKKDNKLVKELDPVLEQIEKSVQLQIREYNKLVSELGKNPLEGNQSTSFIVSKLKTAIYSLPDDCDEDAMKELETGLRSLIVLIRSIEKQMNEILLKMKDKQWDETNQIAQAMATTMAFFQEQFASVFIKIREMEKKKKKTDQNPWSKKQRGESPLAIAVTGGDTITGWASGYGPARYLSTEQVKLIAHALKATTYRALASKNNTGIADFEDSFDQFNYFFQEAAKNKEAIICVFI
jgi:hypothetical protein